MKKKIGKGVTDFSPEGTMMLTMLMKEHCVIPKNNDEQNLKLVGISGKIVVRMILKKVKP